MDKHTKAAKIHETSLAPPGISVVIPVYNQAVLLRHTLESLKRQTFKDFEMIVVDDHSSDNSSSVAEEYTKKVFKNIKNSGPAFSRNLGIKVAEGDIIAFTDSDCVADEKWLENLYNEFKNEKVGAVMGNTTIPPSTYVGDSISALGFPAGGSIGFDKIWKVNADGFTDHISACNLAIRKSVLENYGAFDESFPLAGGEDTELSCRYVKKGVGIKYSQQSIVRHVPRTSLLSFIKWQLKRGESNYHLKRKIGDVSDFVKLRLWSTKNILKHHIKDSKLPMVFLLLGMSFVLQQIGYFMEKRKNEKKRESY